LLFATPREKHLLSSIERATRQPITEMALPTVEDVNTQRVAKFFDAIASSLGSPELSFFRRLINDFEQEHNLPLADIAAALAVLSQDESFLLKPEPPAPRRTRDRDIGTREGGSRDRASHDGGSRDHASRDGGARGASPRKSRSNVEMAKYRISVGRRQKVQPGQIVGAIANEGGLARGDFGHIDIQADHSVVELPADLSPNTFAALKGTRISGQLIELTRADGPPSSRAKRDATGKKFDKPRKDREH
jgi:ATP-dependent RNA helicase DeaD